MDYIVIKAEFISEAKERWGENTVNYVFEILNQNHPDVTIKNLTEIQEFEKLDCLLFLLQNKYRNR